MSVYIAPDQVLVDTRLRTANDFSLISRAAFHSLWDRLSNPTVHSCADIPWQVQSITPEWLDAVFRQGGHEQIVEAVEIESHSAGTSVRGRLRIAYTDYGSSRGLPASLFCKSTPSFVTRMANGVSNTMTFEQGFYRYLREKLQLEAPLGYFSNCDPRSLRSIHLLEDLVATKGAEFCHIDTSINFEEARDIVRTLAKLHGTFLSSSSFQKNCAWLSDFRSWYLRGAEVTNVEKSHNKALSVSINENVIPIGLKNRTDEIYPKFLKSLENIRGLEQTLIHSDVHLGNWYKTRDGNMGLCDWQCVAKGHWSRDLAYALSTTLQIEDRRRWERQLIELYVDQLSISSGRQFSVDEAWLRYRQYLPAALMMWTPTLISPRFLPNMQPYSLALELIKRIATAIDDHDALDAIS